MKPAQRAVLFACLWIGLTLCLAFTPGVSWATPGIVRWTLDSLPVEGSAALDEHGTVYFGDMDESEYGCSGGTLHAVNGTTGKSVWTIKSEYGSVATPAMDLEGRIFFPTMAPQTGRHKIMAVNASNGEIIWEHFRGVTFYSSPALGPEGILYIGSFGALLHAVNCTNGERVWTATQSTASSATPSIGPNGMVYIGDYLGAIYALNGTTGATIWTNRISQDGILATPAIGADGTLYVGTAEKKLFALNGTTGAVIWTFTGGYYMDSSPTVGFDGTVYVGCDDFNIYAVNGSTGAKKWSFATGDGVFSSPTIGKDGTVYAASFDNNVYALEGSTGKKLWSVKLPGKFGIVGSPAIGTDGNLYIGTLDGGFYAIETGSKGLADGPWPAFQLNNRNRGYNFPPESDPGPDHGAKPGEFVLLNGLNSEDVDGEIIAFKWTQVAGPAVELANNDTVHAIFQAPSVGPGGVVLKFSLAVTDNNLAVGSNTISITVNNQDKGPTANAGPDQNVRASTVVTLDGANSTNGTAPISTYAWNQTSGPAVSLTNPSAAMTTFLAPNSTSSLTFKLTVTDTQGLSDTDRTIVNVSLPKVGPVVNVGPDKNATEGSTVLLSAANSTDPDGAIVAYHWSQTDGRTVVLSEDDAVNATFVVPCVGNTTLYSYCVPNGTVFEFTATVTDDLGLKGEDSLTVTALKSDASGVPDGYIALRTANGSNSLGLNASQGTALVFLESENASSVAPNGTEPGETPYGLLAFTLKVARPGDSANLTVALDAPASENATWYKYTNATGWYDYTADTAFSADRTLITVELTDGGKGDSDGRADGFIVDPSGLVNSTVKGGDSSSNSGCLANPRAGFGLEWLLLAVGPLLALPARRRRR